jgi:hypothetical protein
MTKFDWEKQNRKEMVSKSFDLPATEDNQWVKDAEKHSKKRALAKKYRNTRVSLAIKRKKEAPAFNRGVESGKIQERERILKDLTDLADRFNTSTPTSHWIRDLYRFIETEFARTHENNLNPRFADAEILDFRTNARIQGKDD